MQYIDVYKYHGRTTRHDCCKNQNSKGQHLSIAVETAKFQYKKLRQRSKNAVKK